MSNYTTQPEKIEAFKFKTIPELKAFLKKTEYGINETKVIHITHPQHRWQIFKLGDYVAIFGKVLQVIPPDIFENFYYPIDPSYVSPNKQSV